MSVDGKHGWGQWGSPTTLPPARIAQLVVWAQDTKAPAVEREAARNAVVRANLLLVMKVARAYVRRGAMASFEDIVQAGALGLMRAVETFDTSRGFMFSTYAVPWIRAAIGEELARAEGGGTYGRGVAGRRIKAQRVAARAATRGEASTLGECAEHVASELDVGEETAFRLLGVRDTMQLHDIVSRGHASADSVDGLTNALAHGGEAEALDAIHRTRLISRVAHVMYSEMSARQQAVLVMRYGPEEMSLREIGRVLGVCGERVRQWEAAALGLLRARLCPHIETPSPATSPDKPSDEPTS